MPQITIFTCLNCHNKEENLHNLEDFLKISPTAPNLWSFGQAVNLWEFSSLVKFPGCSQNNWLHKFWEPGPQSISVFWKVPSMDLGNDGTNKEQRVMPPYPSNHIQLSFFFLGISPRPSYSPSLFISHSSSLFSSPFPFPTHASKLWTRLWHHQLRLGKCALDLRIKDVSMFN